MRFSLVRLWTGYNEVRCPKIHKFRDKFLLFVLIFQVLLKLTGTSTQTSAKSFALWTLLNSFQNMGFNIIETVPGKSTVPGIIWCYFVFAQFTDESSKERKHQIENLNKWRIALNIYVALKIWPIKNLFVENNYFFNFVFLSASIQHRWNNFIAFQARIVPDSLKERYRPEERRCSAGKIN